jgi:hypothetical protein
MSSRITSQIHNERLLMPQSGGTSLQIFDLNTEKAEVIPLPTNMTRLTSQMDNRKLLLPQHAGPTLEILTL